MTDQNDHDILIKLQAMMELMIRNQGEFMIVNASRGSRTRSGAA
jgi:hypothetical protein